MRRPAASDNQSVGDEFDYYQDTSGIQPWVPPAGFTNPVPPARDDATPAGHKDSWRASVQRHGSDSGGRTGPPRWLLLLIGIAVFGIFVVKPWVDDNSGRVDELIDDAEKILKDFRDSVETDAGGSSSDGYDVDLPADGESQLPGRYASLRYKILPGEREWTQRKDEPTRFSGSDWGVLRENQDGESFMGLGYYVLDREVTDDHQQDAAGQISSQLSADFGRAPEFTPIETDGRPGFLFRGTDSDGLSRLVVWYFGEEHSYRFVCNSQPSDPQFWKTCRSAYKTLRFRR